MIWGTSLWGSSIWGPTVTPFTALSPQGSISAEITGYQFPLAFISTGDLAQNDNERVSADTARTAIMTIKNGVPLSDVGSTVPLLAFDPNDSILSGLIAYQISRAVRGGSKAIEVVDISLERVGDYEVRVTVSLRDARLATNEFTFTVLSTAHGWRTDQTAYR